jgi:hypothetical protein
MDWGAAVRLRRLDGVAVSALSPGDICVVVKTGHESSWDLDYMPFGKTVIVIGISPEPPMPWQIQWVPFWRCTGMPPGITSISHAALEKIHPDFESERSEEWVSV